MNGTLQPAELADLLARASREGWTGVLRIGDRTHVLVRGTPLRATALAPVDAETAWAFDERGELAARVDPALARGFVDAALAAPKPADPAPSAVVALALGDVETEFAQRAGRDFYGFLGLDRTASGAEIERRAKQLEDHFGELKSTLSGERAAMAGRLVLGARITRMRLLDPAFRSSYDQALASGQGMLL